VGEGDQDREHQGRQLTPRRAAFGRIDFLYIEEINSPYVGDALSESAVAAGDRMWPASGAVRAPMGSGRTAGEVMVVQIKRAPQRPFLFLVAGFYAALFFGSAFLFAQ
jgi:hypothetical protein